MIIGLAVTIPAVDGRDQREAQVASEKAAATIITMIIMVKGYYNLSFVL